LPISGHRIPLTVPFRREEQTQKIDRLRDETLKAIARNTGEMAAFKTAAADAIEGMLIAAQSH